MPNSRRDRPAAAVKGCLGRAAPPHRTPLQPACTRKKRSRRPRPSPRRRRSGVAVAVTAPQKRTRRGKTEAPGRRASSRPPRPPEHTAAAAGDRRNRRVGAAGREAGARRSASGRVVNNRLVPTGPVLGKTRRPRRFFEAPVRLGGKVQATTGDDGERTARVGARPPSSPPRARPPPALALHDPPRGKHRPSWGRLGASTREKKKN